ncbi:MAG TPA: hypothetical protein VGM81_25065 [Burkholderiaceae bacterium]|jgi:hypothetical protein
MNLTSIRWIGLSFSLFASLLAPACLAASVSTGTFDGESRIHGRLQPGDVEDARKAFARGIDRPLLIDLAVDSNKAEVLRLGEWLNSQRPVLDINEQCFGPCAWLVLNSGRALNIRAGSAIVFDTTDFMYLRLRERIESGDLFADAAVTAASRERFLARWTPRYTVSQALMDAAQQRWPANVFDFVKALPGRLDQDRLSFDDKDFNYSLSGEPGHCQYWVPDAEGLRQLGLDVPQYQPATRAAVAKLLKVREGVIYIGPIVSPMPPQGLCPTSSTP